MNVYTTDLKIISFFKKVFLPVARFSLFVVFFWFGILKVVGLSPASGVVENLFNETVSFMSFPTFLILFGLYECLIGVLFLIPKAVRIVIPLLLVHMVTTFMPLYFLRSEMWSGLFVPTLEGQYVIKNLVIIATAIGIASNVTPFQPKPKV